MSGGARNCVWTFPMELASFFFFTLYIIYLYIYIGYRIYKRRPGEVVPAFSMFSDLHPLACLSPQESFSETAVAAMPHRESEKLI